jgi:hypothetical protein
MTVQTKLSPTDREQRKTLKEWFPNVMLFSFPVFGVTVGIERTGETLGRFAVSLQGKGEAKFRRKVGELKVLERFADTRTLPIRMPADGTADWIADRIANLVG